MQLTRRHLLGSALTLSAMELFPGISHAQARKLVFATFTGSWEEAHRDVLVPAFKKATGQDVLLDAMLSVDQIAKVAAARTNPPIDVMLHDPGPALVAISQDLVEPFPVAASKYYKDLIPEAQDPMGPSMFFQVVGITYNPETVKTPPTSWADLWKPEYKGRVGITNLNSTLGTGFLVEVARMHGGNEGNVKKASRPSRSSSPTWRPWRPTRGRWRRCSSRGRSTSAGQLQRDPDPEGARRAGGVRGAQGRRHRLQDQHPHREELAQQGARGAAHRRGAVARGAGQAHAEPLPRGADQRQGEDGSEIARVLAKDTADMKKKFVFQDWKKINENRSAWIDRFNREIKI